ncbi:MAG: cation transporter [bacterium]|uniref:Cation transporter n=1 Tax=Candidatus Aphodosoma intestinipullorum TaxID=2840674 RepID=A0A940DII9_9BACT|nr:cation transporter [Candidatus Aphodosoma intestinipullorum]
MAHNHQYAHEHQHTHALQSLNAIFIVCIVLNVAYVAVEAAVGLWVGSLGLLSDAGHNLSDAFSLLLSLFAFKMAQRHSTARFTYGYRKSTVLVSLLNAVILLVAVGAIVIEAVHKLNSPETVSGAAISWTAGVGIAVNGLTAWLLMRSQKHDLNVKGAFLHMLMDTLVSAGVVVSGIIIMFTGWTVVDSIISLIIAAIILVSTWKLLRESLFLSLDAVPEGIDTERIESAVSAADGVAGVHHVHIWAMSTTENAATMHVRIESAAQLESVKHRIKEILHENGITHSTIEFELPECRCNDRGC